MRGKARKRSKGRSHQDWTMVEESEDRKGVGQEAASDLLQAGHRCGGIHDTCPHGPALRRRAALRAQPLHEPRRTRSNGLGSASN